MKNYYNIFRNNTYKKENYMNNKERILGTVRIPTSSASFKSYDDFKKSVINHYFNR
jgi:hypothetical protein